MVPDTGDTWALHYDPIAGVPDTGEVQTACVRDTSEMGIAGALDTGGRLNAGVRDTGNMQHIHSEKNRHCPEHQRCKFKMLVSRTPRNQELPVYQTPANNF